MKPIGVLMSDLRFDLAPNCIETKVSVLKHQFTLTTDLQLVHTCHRQFHIVVTEWLYVHS